MRFGKKHLQPHLTEKSLNLKCSYCGSKFHDWKYCQYRISRLAKIYNIMTEAVRQLEMEYIWKKKTETSKRKIV